MGFPGGARGKEPTGQCRRWRDTGSIPGSGISPGGEHSNPLQYSCLENPVDRGAWWATVHRVAKRLKWLSVYACLEGRELLDFVLRDGYFSPSPAWNTRGFFSSFHHENLVGLLLGVGGVELFEKVQVSPPRLSPSDKLPLPSINLSKWPVKGSCKFLAPAVSTPAKLVSAMVFPPDFRWQFIPQVPFSSHVWAETSHLPLPSF